MTKYIAPTVTAFAFGDAWGYVTEFSSFTRNMQNQPAPPAELVVSDDTQMGIYTLQAILNTSADVSRVHYDVVEQNTMRTDFAEEYVKFYYDKDNNRAPGMTCMSAISSYIDAPQKTTGLEGLTNFSLGCGTIMRTPWIGLLPVERETLVALSVLQSQTTHGDPAGWIVSAIATLMVHDIVQEQVSLDQPLFVHALNLLYEIDAMNLNLLEDTADSFVQVEEELQSFVQHWDTIRVELADPQRDVNGVFGEGWIATEALYNALGVVSLHPTADEAWYGVQRLVYSNGDSDSTAAIASAFYAAFYGDAWHDVDIMSRLEPRYAQELQEVITGIENFSHGANTSR